VHERVVLQLLQVGAGDRVVLFRALVLLDLLELLFLAHLLLDDVVAVLVDQAVDELVDAHLVLLDQLGHAQDLLDRRRARRDRVDHVLQAVLDALGDLDLALAREELHRAHLAHVHAHRVRGAAELGVDGGRERFLGLLDHVLLGDRGGRLVHEELLGVRGLVVHGDAHVGQHRDHAFDLLGVGHVVRQVVVDLGVSKEPALLAEHDEVLEALFLRLDFGHLYLGLVVLVTRLFHVMGSRSG
jgi:hypothetical protein